MKSLKSLVLGTALALGLSGCSGEAKQEKKPITYGAITKKEYEPERDYDVTYITIDLDGDISLKSRKEHDDEDWVVYITGKNNLEKEETRRFEIKKENYENIAIGDTVVYDPKTNSLLRESELAVEKR